VELRLNCTGYFATVANGTVGLRTLSTADATQYTEIGYDFGRQAFYADHSKCCDTHPNAIVQRAPLPASSLGAILQLSVFVDGGIIEAYLGGLVITPLVAPDASAGGPEVRQSRAFSEAAGVDCTAESWQLQY